MIVYIQEQFISRNESSTVCKGNKNVQKRKKSRWRWRYPCSVKDKREDVSLRVVLKYKNDSRFGLVRRHLAIEINLIQRTMVEFRTGKSISCICNVKKITNAGTPAPESSAAERT